MALRQHRLARNRVGACLTTADRFRDKEMIEGQMEYRFPIWGRWGGTVFFGAGEVAPSVLNFSPARLKPAGGLGLRFAVIPKERINIRLDFAYTDFAGLVYYLDINEAF